MFGSSMLSQFEDDPFFRGHFDGMQQMHQSMMQGFGGGFFGGPFGGVPAIGYTDPSGRQRNQQVAMRGRPPADPFGSIFSDMNRMMGGMPSMMQSMHRQMGSAQSDPNSHFYSQSTVMSYSNTGQGPPKVFQASSSTHQAPGGVRETRRAVRDSEQGIEKMSIGHHIRDRAHVIERKRDARTGEQEENQELINLDDDERDTFDREFREKMGAYSRRAPGNSIRGAGRPDRHRPRAITQEAHNRYGGSHPYDSSHRSPEHGRRHPYHRQHRTPPPPTSTSAEQNQRHHSSH